MMVFKRIRFAAAAAALLLPIQTPATLAKSATAPIKKVTMAAASAPASDDSAVRAVLAALSTYASNGDAAKMAALWTEDGSYVDEDGEEVQGRKALEARFASALKVEARSSVKLSPSIVKSLGAEAAFAEGVTTRQTNSGVDSSNRFTILLQKQEGKWMIASATETAVITKTITDRLSELSWLIGDWSCERGDAKVKMSAEWTANHNFVLCRYNITLPGSTAKTDIQVIGWDPTKEQIVSWHFDSNGGFGYGSWDRNGKQWLVHAEGVDPSGVKTDATNVIVQMNNDKFSWQSVDRNVDGQPVPDTEALTVQRVGKQQALGGAMQ